MHSNIPFYQQLDTKRHVYLHLIKLSIPFLFYYLVFAVIKMYEAYPLPLYTLNFFIKFWILSNVYF